MKFPELEYISWAKSMPHAEVNLARSGVEPCPASLLKLSSRDLVVNLPVTYGYEPLRDAIADRYGVSGAQVFTVSGGTSFANFVACAAALDGAASGVEALVEHPTYEPLVKVPAALGFRVRRFERRFEDEYAIDVQDFASRVTPRTRLAIVSNLHNPSGARVDLDTLARMARVLRRVGGVLLVDEVYLECLFGGTPASCVHAAPNVVTTNSLTKAYGLDGLRAGWLLGPARLIRSAQLANDLMTNNGVAPAERMALAAFRRLSALRRRSRALLDPNLNIVRTFLTGETRLNAIVPPGGNVAFPRLPRGIDGGRFCDRLLRQHSTLVVPGRFFGERSHFRFSFGCAPALLERGLRSISATLDAMS
jgi:aspartate/methionine/tyrosine aminotransferase